MAMSGVCTGQTHSGGGLLDLDDQRLLRALVSGDRSPAARSPHDLQVQTDLELVQALRSLRSAGHPGSAVIPLSRPIPPKTHQNHDGGGDAPTNEVPAVRHLPTSSRAKWCIVCREECVKLMSGTKKLKAAPKPKAARPQKKLPKPESALPAIGPPSTPDKLTRAAAAAGQRSFTTPVPLSSGPKCAQPSRARTVQPIVLADRFHNAFEAAPTSGDSTRTEEPLMTLRASGVQKRDGSRAKSKVKSAGAGVTGSRMEVDGGALTSDDNLSMTGLVNSPADSCSDHEAMTHRLVSVHSGISPEASGGSGSEDSDSSAAHRRQAHKFIAAAHVLAAPAMQPRSDSPAKKEHEGRSVVDCSAQQAADAEEDARSREDLSDSDESEASLGAPLGSAGGSRLPSLALSESEEKSVSARHLPEDNVVVRALSQASNMHRTATLNFLTGGQFVGSQGSAVVLDADRGLRLKLFDMSMCMLLTACARQGYSQNIHCMKFCDLCCSGEPTERQLHVCACVGQRQRRGCICSEAACHLLGAL